MGTMKKFFEMAIEDMHDLSDEEFKEMASNMGFNIDSREKLILLRKLNDTMDEALLMTQTLTDKLKAKSELTGREE